MISLIYSALGLIFNLSVHHLKEPFIRGVGYPLPITFAQNEFFAFGVTIADLIGNPSLSAALPKASFILLK